MTKCTGIVLACGMLIAASSAALAKPRGPIDKECAGSCRTERKQCYSAARETGRTCLATTCAVEAEAARNACSADPLSDACTQAKQALRTCATPCLEAHKTALRACRTAAGSCVEECPQRTPKPRPGKKDGECVADCRRGRNTCLTTARHASRACAAECADEIAAAKAACTGNPAERPGVSRPKDNVASPACTAARAAARACLEPCETAQRQAVRSCEAAADACVSACPERENPGRGSGRLRSRH